MTRLFPFLISILFLTSPDFSQTTNLGREVNQISGFIASEQFAKLNTKLDDLAITDSLFKRVLAFENGNYPEALFALTFAAIPYNKVPIKIPLLPVIFDYPLVSAGDSVFNLKNKNLPKSLSFDSPPDDFGDKDKLAHFFGSAFLSYSSSFFDLGDLIGYFVEVFEQDFKVQSSIDQRDLEADTLGDIFGRMLKKDKNILPSQVFLIKSFFYLRYHL